MTEAIGDLEGFKVFVDDILVFGQGETKADAVRDHDAKVHKLFKRLNECSIKLNQDKIQFKKERLTYMGHVISSDGLQVDEEKVRAISEMLPPKNVKELRSFLGMINYIVRNLFPIYLMNQNY